MDPEGRTYVPELKDFPSDYVHRPWLAPLYVQQQANCVIGEHYPVPLYVQQQANCVIGEHYPLPIVEVCKQGALCCKRIQGIMHSLQDVYSNTN